MFIQSMKIEIVLLYIVHFPDVVMKLCICEEELSPELNFGELKVEKVNNVILMTHCHYYLLLFP